VGKNRIEKIRVSNSLAQARLTFRIVSFRAMLVI